MEKNIINIDAHVIDDIRTIITRARNRAYQSINETLIRSNWEIGKRIVEEEQLGKQRADYGIQLIKSISQQLTTEFGSAMGFVTLPISSNCTNISLIGRFCTRACKILLGLI